MHLTKDTDDEEDAADISSTQPIGWLIIMTLENAGTLSRSRTEKAEQEHATIGFPQMGQIAEETRLSNRQIASITIQIV